MSSSICDIAKATRVHVVRHIRRLRGGSQAHLLAGSDGEYWVTKFQNNPQSIRVLANEMLATRLGAALGLPVPIVEMIEVPQTFVEKTPELTIQLGDRQIPCAYGRQLGSRYVCDPTRDVVFDYLPDALLQNVSNLQDFARVLVLDRWAANADGRQAVFSSYRSENKFKATLCCGPSYVMREPPVRPVWELQKN